MKIAAKKLNKIIHNISNLATKVKLLELKANGESELANKLKKIENSLINIRQDILLSINNNNNEGEKK